MLELRFPLDEAARQQAAKVRSMVDAGRRREVGLDLARALAAAVERVRPLRGDRGTWLVGLESLHLFDRALRPVRDWPLPLLLPSGQALEADARRPTLCHGDPKPFAPVSLELAWWLDDRRTAWVWRGGYRQEIKHVGLLHDGENWHLCAQLNYDRYLELQVLADGDYVLAGQEAWSAYDDYGVRYYAYRFPPDVQKVQTLDYESRPRGQKVAQEHYPATSRFPRLEVVGDHLKLENASFTRPPEYPAGEAHYRLADIFARAWDTGEGLWLVDAWSGHYVAARYFSANAT